jgi:broad specificity phosphatase PhoE
VRIAARRPIWLVRHAPTAWTGRRWCGRSDPGLTRAGRVAARRVAAELAIELDGGPAIVITSPLRRALETAARIARALGGARVQIDPDLAEVDFGAADGLTWDELARDFPGVAEAVVGGEDPDWPAGETAASRAARARSMAERILDAAWAQEVIVVTHAGMLRAIAPHLGLDLSFGQLEPAQARRVDPVLVPVPVR